MLVTMAKTSALAKCSIGRVDSRFSK